MVTMDPAIGGGHVDFGNGSMQVRTMDADDDGNVVEEVVVVRTDIEPLATAFAKVDWRLACRYTALNTGHEPIRCGRWIPTR